VQPGGLPGRRRTRARVAQLAVTLRERRLQEAVAEGNRASERMFLPVVGFIFMPLLALVVVPALSVLFNLVP
jgi:hypothetical protein